MEVVDLPTVVITLESVKHNRGVDHVLGQGGYGIVYRKDLSPNGNQVAVKRIQIIDKDPKDPKEEQSEIESMRKFNHQNVLKLHCALEDGDFQYLVLELCNATVFDYCEGNYQFYEDAQWNVIDALDQMARGVEYIHSEGFVHRDIHSKNVLIKHEGTTVLFKISDFGNCKQATNSGSFSFGKSGIKTNKVTTAPELLRVYAEGRGASGLNRANKMCDIFSLGCVFYTFLTEGSSLFHLPGNDNFSVPTNILANRYSLAKLKEEHKFAENIIKGMIDPNPERRTSLVTVREELKQFGNVRSS